MSRMFTLSSRLWGASASVQNFHMDHFMPGAKTRNGDMAAENKQVGSACLLDRDAVSKSICL